ncbi:MAG: TIGR00730 family Rossman fold protein [Rickettsiales bacterium]
MNATTQRLDGIKKAVCVFCGAQNAVPQVHLDMGKDLGKRMAEKNISLVYGGGDCGIMGAVANSVMKTGGWVTGVFPESLRNIENEHQSLNEIIIVDTMHTRKELMYRRSDKFVILPGGFGTMDELFEILTWKQLELHNKPIIVFNHEGYWDHLIALMERIISTGFARRETRDLYVVVDNIEDLMNEIVK